jgi:hypothetical protein
MLNYCLVQLLMERPYGMFVVQGLKHPPFDDGGFINFGQYVRTEWMTDEFLDPRARHACTMAGRAFLFYALVDQ